MALTFSGSQSPLPFPVPHWPPYRTAVYLLSLNEHAPLISRSHSDHRRHRVWHKPFQPNTSVGRRNWPKVKLGDSYQHGLTRWSESTSPRQLGSLPLFNFSSVWAIIIHVISTRSHLLLISTLRSRGWQGHGIEMTGDKQRAADTPRARSGGLLP
jgi:hypothetical protein